MSFTLFFAVHSYEYHTSSELQPNITNEFNKSHSIGLILLAVFIIFSRVFNTALALAS